MTWIVPPGCGPSISAPGPEGASLGACSSAMCPSAPSKSTLTASGCSCSGNATGSCPPSRSGTMPEHFPGIPGMAAWIFSTRAFLASPFLSPDSSAGHTTSATYGLTSTGSLARYDPLTCSWRTSQLSLLAGTSEPFSDSLPRVGMIRSGQLLALTMWGLPIAANGSGSWLPTPDANDWKQDGLQASQRRLDRYSTVSLNAAVRLFPTPRANKWGLPDSYGSTAMWATPTANDARNNNSPARQQRRGPALDIQVGGRLNPGWVELLMGWPQDWTALPGARVGTTACPGSSPPCRSAGTGCGPWATARCRCVSPSHGACSGTHCIRRDADGGDLAGPGEADRPQ